MELARRERLLTDPARRCHVDAIVKTALDKGLTPGLWAHLSGAPLPQAPSARRAAATWSLLLTLPDHVVRRMVEQSPGWERRYAAVVADRAGSAAAHLYLTGPELAVELGRVVDRSGVAS